MWTLIYICHKQEQQYIDISSSSAYKVQKYHKFIITLRKPTKTFFSYLYIIYEWVIGLWKYN